MIFGIEDSPLNRNFPGTFLIEVLEETCQNVEHNAVLTPLTLIRHLNLPPLTRLYSESKGLHVTLPIKHRDDERDCIGSFGLISQCDHVERPRRRPCQ